MKTQQIAVWDIFIRFFHWSLAASFLIAYASGEEVQQLHILVGYYILGLVATRLVWGVIGSRYARFSDFVKGPDAVKQHLKEVMAFRPKKHIGHNPVGGWMIIALLATLGLTGLTGLVTYGGEEQAGPLAATVAAWPHWLTEAFEELHEGLANLNLLLVFIHVIGVLLESLLQGENLVRSMLTGKKQVSL